MVFAVFFNGIFFLIFENANYLVYKILNSDVKFGLELISFLFFTLIGIFILIKFFIFIISWVFINKSTVSIDFIGKGIQKINPISGFKSIFGIEAISRSLRKFFEVILLIFIFNYVYNTVGNDLNFLKEINNRNYFIYIFILSLSLVSFLFLVFGVAVSYIDLLFECYHFKQKNRMTLTEMNNEIKDTEGSPEIKAERKMKMREIMETPITKGRTPTFALVNPTHILVPICFEPHVDKVPVVLKISTDLFAQEEKKRLKMINIPIIEHRPLARALYRNMKNGENFIPKEFYRDVAIILSTLKKYEKN